LSMIVAVGAPVMTRAAGRTFRTDGAIPNAQVSVAPLQTQNPIPGPPFLRFLISGLFT